VLERAQVGIARATRGTAISTAGNVNIPSRHHQ